MNPSNSTMNYTATLQTFREIDSIYKEKNTKKIREIITMEAISALSIKCKDK